MTVKIIIALVSLVLLFATMSSTAEDVETESEEGVDAMFWLCAVPLGFVILTLLLRHS